MKAVENRERIKAGAGPKPATQRGTGRKEVPQSGTSVEDSPERAPQTRSLQHAEGAGQAEYEARSQAQAERGAWPQFPGRGRGYALGGTGGNRARCPPLPLGRSGKTAAIGRQSTQRLYADRCHLSRDSMGG